MNHIDRGQVNHNAAEIYEEFFVPALFGEWVSRVMAAAGVQAGQQVLDVACGTGVLARGAAKQVGSAGSVVGIDVNEGMIAVAQRLAPAVTWQKGTAEALPFDNDSFDAVVSQFGLMFFDDKPAAIQEMVRVLRPGGKMAVAVWDTLENTPGYAQMTGLLLRLFGEEAANGLRAPFILGDKAALGRLFAAAGIANTTITTHTGQARFPSIHSWVFTDVKGWTLADMIDDAQFQTLVEAAEKELQPFVTPESSVNFAAPAHIVTYTKN
jgi:SAM-dependent methyltransferase